MKLSGSQVISASRETVWKGLNDPHVLQQCIPGCQGIEQLSPTELTATVVAKIGPVKASFKGNVTLSDIVPPESYRISGQGQGGLAGFATGGAAVKLTSLGANETQMDYDVDAQVGGKMAMLGSRLIDGTARSYAEQFFDRFAELMKSEGAKEVAAIAAPAAKAPTKKPAAKKAAPKKAAAKAKKTVKPVKKVVAKAKAKAKPAKKVSKPVKKKAKKR
jgi:uncharacterized protein